jgi:hypothetical protein
MTTDPTGPTRYATMIRSHYEEWLPARLSQIPEHQRDSYFSTLGEEMGALVATMELSLRGPDPEGEDFMVRLGRFRMARLQAEEVARDQFLPAPADDQAAEPNLVTHGYWESGPIPLVEDPTHPWWIEERRRLEEEEEDERWRLEREQQAGSDPAPKTT